MTYLPPKIRRKIWMWLFNFAAIQRKINTKRALVTRRTFSYRKTARLSPEKLSELHPKADTIPISAHAQWKHSQISPKRCQIAEISILQSKFESLKTTFSNFKSEVELYHVFVCTKETWSITRENSINGGQPSAAPTVGGINAANVYYWPALVLISCAHNVVVNCPCTSIACVQSLPVQCSYLSFLLL